MRPRSYLSYHIDSDDMLAGFNDSWLSFANENNGQALHPDALGGRPIWEFITDATTVHLYKVMIRRVRDGAAPIAFQFRCDAPEKRRLLKMEMSGRDAGGVTFKVSTVEEQSRPSVPSFPASVGDHAPLVTMCSWCKRVSVGGGRWLEVELVLRQLGLMERPVPHLITHGICADCARRVEGVSNGDNEGEDNWMEEHFSLAGER